MNPRVETFSRRNWWLHVLEGGLYIGGMGFISNQTVAPVLVRETGGPDWLVAATPVMTFVGFSLAPILTAHRIDRLPRFMPVLLVTGIIQRLPLLAAAILLWWLGRREATPWIIAGTPLVAGFLGGLTLTAWQQLFAKTVPAEQRSACFAARFIITSLIGLGAGLGVEAILHHNPGVSGYALLHLCAFIGAALSYVLFTRLREGEASPVTDDHATRGFTANLASAHDLIIADKRLGLLLVTLVLGMAQFLVTGFLVVHARQVLDAPESYTGVLTTASMAGGLLANIVAMLWGDAVGAGRLLVASRLLFVVGFVTLPFLAGDWAFRIILAVWNAGYFLNHVAIGTLSLDLLPPERRATTLAIIGLVQVPGMLGFSLLGSWLWSRVPFPLMCGLGAVIMLAALVVAWPLRSVGKR